jgi:tRNA (cytidine56-2'-O)-methyltransferase
MITVLRIGHRIPRDQRITTHVALVARAFGADNILIDTKDTTLEETIGSTCQRFGGTFSIQTGVNRKTVLRQWKGLIVHLTMYGERLDEALPRIDKNRDLLIVVGAEKVPAELYEIADFNIAVGNQPHSEVAALSLFLDRYTGATWQDATFEGNIEIIPCKKGKTVRQHAKENN